MEYCDTCKLDTNHGGYAFCPTETKAKLDAAILQNEGLQNLLSKIDGLVARLPLATNRRDKDIMNEIARLLMDHVAEKPKQEVPVPIRRGCICGPEGMCDYHRVTDVTTPIEKRIGENFEEECPAKYNEDTQCGKHLNHMGRHMRQTDSGTVAWDGK